MRLNVELDEELYHAFHMACLAKKKKMTIVIKEMILAYLTGK